jgi:hypothetical protein
MIDPDCPHVTGNRERDIDLATDVAMSAVVNLSWDRASVPPHGGNDATQGWGAKFRHGRTRCRSGAMVLQSS